MGGFRIVGLGWSDILAGATFSPKIAKQTAQKQPLNKQYVIKLSNIRNPGVTFNDILIG